MCQKTLSLGNLNKHIKEVHINVKTVCEICSLEMPKSKFYSHRKNVHNMKPLREKARPRARISVLKASMNKQERAAQGIKDIKGEENGNNQAFGTITPRANTFHTPISVLKVTTNLHQGAGQDINGEEAGNERRLQSQSQASVKTGQGEKTLEGLFEVAKLHS